MLDRDLRDRIDSQRHSRAISCHLRSCHSLSGPAGRALPRLKEFRNTYINMLLPRRSTCIRTPSRDEVDRVLANTTVIEVIRTSLASIATVVDRLTQAQSQLPRNETYTTNAFRFSVPRGIMGSLDGQIACLSAPWREPGWPGRERVHAPLGRYAQSPPRHFTPI